MNGGNRTRMRQLFQEHDIESTNDIQDALDGGLKEMVETEMKECLGYGKSERSDSDNARNGYKPKTLNSSFGNFEIDAPTQQYRQSSFEQRGVEKRQKDLSHIE